MNPKTPDQNSIVYFTITVLDNEQGSGISSVTLYVDGEEAGKIAGYGTFICTGGPYPSGVHNYKVIAVDRQNNMGADPATGTYTFEVPGSTQETSSENSVSLWIVLAVFAAMLAISVTVILRPKRKKTYQLLV